MSSFDRALIDPTPADRDQALAEAGRRLAGHGRQ
jgi:hypothetical protein